MSAPADPLAAFRPSAGQLVTVALAACAALLYPSLVETALQQLGVRSVAGALLVVAAASLLLGRGATVSQELIHLPHGARVGFAVPLLLGLVSGDAHWLRLIPALIQLWLAALFALSLRDPRSLVERMALLLQPRAPDFIASYCRRVTVLWTALFLFNALMICALVFLAAPETARWFSAYGTWLVLGAVSSIEYCVRKAHFRYYEPTGIDRLWARLLPAESTALGRRSLAYIDGRKAEMRAAGLTPPGERSPAQ